MPCTATERLETGTAIAHSLRDSGRGGRGRRRSAAGAGTAGGAGSWISTSSWSMITCGRWAKPVAPARTRRLGTAANRRPAVGGRRRRIAPPNFRPAMVRRLDADRRVDARGRSVPVSRRGRRRGGRGIGPMARRKRRIVGGSSSSIVRRQGERALGRHLVLRWLDGATERAEIGRLGLAGDFLGKPDIRRRHVVDGRGGAGRDSLRLPRCRAMPAATAARPALPPRLLLRGEATVARWACRCSSSSSASCRGSGLVLLPPARRAGSVVRAATAQRLRLVPLPASLPPAEYAAAGWRMPTSLGISTGARGRRGARAEREAAKEAHLPPSLTAARPRRSRAIMAA